MHSIDILLPVYNGAKYLNVLIDSILNQSSTDWKLIIRDDGSTDGGREILKKYAGENPERIELLKYGERLGIIKNIERLLDYSTSDYIMLCDQDDMWLPEKVEKSYKKIKKMEKESGKDTPILVHSDLIVTDENLNIIDRSFWKYQHLNPELGRSLNRLLVKNIVTGCTVIINRKLKEYVSRLPDEAIMHDWWLAINAAAFGRIGFIAEPLVYYRQHGENAIGTHKFNLLYVLDSFINKRELIKQSLQNTQKQAAIFLKVNAPRLSPGDYKAAAAFADIGKNNFLIKRWILLKYGFFNSGFVRTVGVFFFI